MKEENIQKLANECIGCLKKPCQQGCPLSNDTTGFIKLIKEKKYQEAYDLLCETTVLQPICGRICPHAKQCQGKCIKGYKSSPVAIGAMEAFIGDLAIKNAWSIPKVNELKTEKIAIIGGGPAGLTCAAFLAQNGYQVTIYEKHNYLGGLLQHGIPDFRLPKNILEATIDKILKLGITTNLNQTLGIDFTLEDLNEKYDAIFIGVGANTSQKMNIEGENLEGVYGGNELLENITHPNYQNKIVIVSGGGNVAIDVARTAKKLGAEQVKIIYRRSEKEMPAEPKEIAEAKDEGIEFLFQTNILKIKGRKKLNKIECIKTELKNTEDGSRPIPVNIEGSNFELIADYVIMAVGSKPDEETMKNITLELDSKNKIVINENGQTSNPKIFAGGDITKTTSTVAFAARSGVEAAHSIINYLNEKSSK